MRDRKLLPLGGLGLSPEERAKLRDEHLAVVVPKKENDNSIEDDDITPHKIPQPTRNTTPKSMQSKNPNWITMNDDIKDALQMLNDLSQAGRLTPWEENFLASVDGFATTKGGLTYKQVETMRNIIDRRG